MKSLGAALEWMLNGLSVCLAVVLLALVAENHLFRSNDTTALAAPQLGSVLNLPDTDWTANRLTLVLALQTRCRWCELSTDFYRDLVQANSRGMFHAMAVFPQDTLQGHEFLKSANIDISDVRQIDLLGLGVHATPTIILADENGHVKSVWTGKLSEKQEEEVFTKLGLIRPLNGVSRGQIDDDTGGCTTSPNMITASQFVKLRSKGTFVPVIDIRSRTDYKRGHIPGSLNIPEDELEARATHEVPVDATVVVYCDYSPSCVSFHTSIGVGTSCTLGEAWLRKLGFSRVMILNDDLIHLGLAGVELVSIPDENSALGLTPNQGSF